MGPAFKHLAFLPTAFSWGGGLGGPVIRFSKSSWHVAEGIWPWALGNLEDKDLSFLSELTLAPSTSDLVERWKEGVFVGYSNTFQ